MCNEKVGHTLRNAHACCLQGYHEHVKFSICLCIGAPLSIAFVVHQANVS